MLLRKNYNRYAHKTRGISPAHRRNILYIGGSSVAQRDIMIYVEGYHDYIG